IILLLSIFLVSLIALCIIFGRKLELLAGRGGMESDNITIEIPYVAEIKQITIRKVKRFGYVALVTSIRIYFRSSNLLKSRYAEIRDKMENAYKNDFMGIEKKEINKFLKVVSDYKQKIRKIKHRIKEEEKMVNFSEPEEGLEPTTRSLQKSRSTN